MSPKGDAITRQENEPEPHSQPLSDIISSLGTDPERGISSQKAEARLTSYGPNALPRIRPSFWRVYLAPILNGLILIYIISTAALFLLGNIGQASIWFSIIVFNALLAIIQQYRAEKKLEALQALSADTIIVVREGIKQEIDTTLVVPGDLLALAQGDLIPADGRIIKASNLTAGESSLTGESAPVEKDLTEKPLPEETPLHARSNMVYRGTFVATGSAMCIVTGTGESTEIGKISQGLETLSTSDIPLRQKVNRLALVLGIAVVILLVVSLTVRLLFPHPSEVLTLSELAAEALTNAMTVMPINIPLLTTITLLTGVLAMARYGVVVRDLSAVESLGRVSVICTDKTGTLTRSEMVTDLVWDGEQLYKVTGKGYEPKGKIYAVESIDENVVQIAKTPVDLKVDSRLALLIRIGGMNNDAEIQTEESDEGEIRWKAVGNPTEAALLALFRKSHISEQSLSEFQMVRNYPFDSRLKRMTRVFTHPDGGHIAFVKGATDVLLSRCTRVGDEKRSQKLTPKRAKAISKYASEFAAGGYRVLSLAFRRLKKLPASGKETERDEIEKSLTFVGFVCILDPPREGVREAVKECKHAGIKTVMVTGDSAATACTVGRQLEIVEDEDLICEGKEATELSADKFQRTSVFARVDPDDKQIIVQRYKDADRAVAVTGDGVNDALALSISDVGIAMGITGTDVAKEASDMIIADDSFTSIVEGIRQGRSLFNKIRMMIFFYVAINLAESILFFGTFLFRITFLSYWQHIFLTISSHTWPGLALVFDRPAKDAMEETPRNTESIINRQLAVYLVLNAILISIGVAVAYFFTWGAILPGSTHLAPYSIEALQKAQMVSITVLLFAESFMILSIRRINQPLTRSIRRESYWFIYAMIGLVFLMHWGLMYVPIMYPDVLASYAGGLFGYLLGLFEYIALNSFDWLIAFSLALPAIVGMELVKWGSRKRGITY